MVLLIVFVYETELQITWRDNMLSAQREQSVIMIQDNNCQMQTLENEKTNNTCRNRNHNFAKKVIITLQKGGKEF